MDNKSGKSLLYYITEDSKGKRIDTFLASCLQGISRSRSQSLIREGNVKVNEFSVKSSYRLRPGDQISVFIPSETTGTIKPEQVDFSLIYEDPSIIVLDKPPGLVIHPAPGHDNGTLVHGLLHHSTSLSRMGGEMRPGIVHRLDKDTSGLMVVAKNDNAHKFLSSQFKEGTVNKRYTALVHGMMPGNEGVIDFPVARHPKKKTQMAVVPSGGKNALTIWQKEQDIGNRFTLLKVILKTGRTHQIRVHLSYIGHPVLGDPVYGYRKSWWKKHFQNAPWIPSRLKRQMLHAGILGFVNPETNDYCEFESPLPVDIKNVLRDLKSIFV